MSNNIIIKAAGVRALQAFVAKLGLQVLQGHASIFITKPGALKNIRVYLSASTGEHFSLYKKQLDQSNTIMAYIWNVDVEPKVFVMTPSEALEFLGPKPQLTESWQRQGYYKWSSSSGMPPDRKERFLARYSNRGQWLKSLF